MTKNYWSIGLVIVMGILIFLLGWKAFKDDQPKAEGVESTKIQGQSIPLPTNYVTDTADIVDTETEEYLNKTLKEFSDSGKGEIGVLTVKSMGGLSVEEFAIRVAEKWKIGDKGVDNGVLVVISTEERKVRIEVGRGVAITDAKAGDILDTAMVPKLKRADWNGAIKDGVEMIISNFGK